MYRPDCKLWTAPTRPAAPPRSSPSKPDLDPLSTTPAAVVYRSSVSRLVQAIRMCWPDGPGMYQIPCHRRCWRRTEIEEERTSLGSLNFLPGGTKWTRCQTSKWELVQWGWDAWGRQFQPVYVQSRHPAGRGQRTLRHPQGCRSLRIHPILLVERDHAIPSLLRERASETPNPNGSFACDAIAEWEQLSRARRERATLESRVPAENRGKEGENCGDVAWFATPSGDASEDMRKPSGTKKAQVSTRLELSLLRTGLWLL